MFSRWFCSLFVIVVIVIDYSDKNEFVKWKCIDIEFVVWFFVFCEEDLIINRCRFCNCFKVCSLF
jgi:hypothetical protein